MSTHPLDKPAEKASLPSPELSKKIAVALETGQPLSFTIANPENSENLDRVLSEILECIRRPELKLPLVYCFDELLTNAHKAVAKRAYFCKRGLKIEDPVQYARGIKDFKVAWLSNIESWQQYQLELGYSIQTVLQCRDGFLLILIANTGTLLPVERERIQMQTQFFRQQDDIIVKDIDDLPALDQIEGGGLGLPLVFGMLSKLGCPQSSLDFRSEPGKTITVLKVPLANLVIPPATLHAELADEIDSLPPFPENILNIQGMLNDPEIEIKRVAGEIGRDPALAAALFKTANSAAYMRLVPVSDLVGALTVVGMKGLRNLLYFFGVELSLGKRYSGSKQVFAHSFETAGYARRLAAKISPQDQDIAFVGGLLHDIGKLIIFEKKSQLMRKLGEMTRAGTVPEWLIENLAFGLDHAQLGGMVADRWRFPASFIDMIRYHHTPSAAPEENAHLVRIIYFADIAESFVNGDFHGYMLDMETVKALGCKSEGDAMELAKLIVFGK
ncbi:MAG: HDOD domain-containing protein [Candidatus Riflebacteria bacterium]|nr:HDOD domain-containing protein [Candidatus Riflebacteria bacterium]